MMRRPAPRFLLLATLMLAGCTVGPDYRRPAAPLAPRYKEAAGWVPSHPADTIDRGAWWTMFGDPMLDKLEQRIATANQTVKEYEAAYRAAHQAVAEAHASLFPTISADASLQRTHGASSGNAVSSGATRTTSLGEVEASWVPDLWGKVRRTVESNRDLAQASAADLANARLAAQSALAADYFELRVLDEQARLYRDTVADYQQFQTLTTNQYEQGTQARSAVITAQTQLYGAQAALVDIGVRRSAMEHAIAALVGVTPAELTIAPAAFSHDAPVAPTEVASTLLERRPDIAAAERRMAAANAQIGIAVSAYFPDLSLSGGYGAGGSGLGTLLRAGTSLWSIGADIAETLFDFGARRAKVRAARATYDESVAAYRQTVLTAFQGVEDELAALRVYQEEEAVLVRTQSSAQEAVQLDLNQYKEGMIDYTTVITAQATALAASRSLLTVQQERLQASVLLVENLGGGWSSRDLPKG